MSEPPPSGDELIGGLLCIGAIFALGLVVWLVSKQREREYEESPQACAIRERVGPGSRFVVNQGEVWLTIAPDVLLLQPKVFGPYRATDLVISRAWVRCIDFQNRKDDDVLNVYGLDGRLVVALASPHSSAIPQLLAEAGWPIGERLRWRPDPPTVVDGLPAPPPIRWARYYDTNAKHIG